MAKKAVAECSAPVNPEYTPRLYIDLDGQDTKQIKGLVIGEEVELVVTGKVVGLNQRQREEDGKTRTSGTIDLEGYRVRVMGSEDNEFEQMAEDE